MKNIRNWKKYTFVGLDTNVFSYHLHQDPLFGHIAKEIFDLLSIGQLQAVTSIITLIEILSVKAPANKIKGLKELFSEIPNLKTVEVNSAIAIKAAEIRRTYGFRTPDAIQLATAIYEKADVFITNDEKLTRCKGVKILLIPSL